MGTLGVLGSWAVVPALLTQSQLLVLEVELVVIHMIK